MSADPSSPHVVQGRRLALNSVLNLVTGLLILALGLLFVPLLIHAFGTELYGVLSVTWMVLANLAWLDLGFSRAAARFVAQELAAGRPEEAALWGWTAVLTQLCVGAFGAVLLFVFAPKLVTLLHVQPDREQLVTLALQVFAFAVPIDLAARSMNGVLQAGQRFGWINALNLLGTLVTYAVYGAAIMLGSNFHVVIFGLFALRLVNLAATFAGAVRTLPTLKRLPRPSLMIREYRSHAAAMLRYGGWVSVSALVGVLLLYFDQWMVGVVLGVAMLPFYVVPLNLLGRLAIFPSSLTSTLFPAFSSLHAAEDWQRIEGYFLRSHRYVLIALVPILFILFVWASDLLRLWIGAEFAAQAALPMRILVVGFGIGLLAPISGALIEAAGRPDILTKLYMVEVPINLALVWALTRAFGVDGAAWSYTLRTVFETIALWILVRRLVPLSLVAIARSRLVHLGGLVAAMALAAALIDTSHFNLLAVAETLLALSLYCGAVLFFMLDESDRAMAGRLRGRIPGFRPPRVAAESTGDGGPA